MRRGAAGRLWSRGYNASPPNAKQRKFPMSLFRKTALLLVSLALAGQALAQQMPVPPSLAAKSWLLLDMGSNQVLDYRKTG